jgi:hypothetical protein
MSKSAVGRKSQPISQKSNISSKASICDGKSCIKDIKVDRHIMINVTDPGVHIDLHIFLFTATIWRLIVIKTFLTNCLDDITKTIRLIAVKMVEEFNFHSWKILDSPHTNATELDIK